MERLGGGTDTVPGADDAALPDELVGYGAEALPALFEGLTFPTGFAEKRALVCEALGRIGDPGAAPYLASALSDSSPLVSEWACWALEASTTATRSQRCSATPTAPPAASSRAEFRPELLPHITTRASASG